MAIRKDIDDMLNNLKDGNTFESPKTPKIPPAQKNSDLRGMTSFFSDDSEIAEELTSKPRKMKIVINHELPDYEAIRQEDLRKNAELAEEAERKAAEEAKKARIEAERRLAEEAEKARIEAERKAAEEAEKARIEAERRIAEEAEKARIEAERKAAEEAEIARLEAQRRAEEEARRVAHLEAQRIALEEAEKARIEAERKAAEEAEKARIEAERRVAEEAELARIEAERKAAEEAELARLEAERMAVEESIYENNYTEDYLSYESTSDISDSYDTSADDSSFSEQSDTTISSEDNQEFQFLKNAPQKEDTPQPSADTPKESITSVLHNILDEDPDEIMNQRNSMTEYDGISKKGRLKKIFYSAFGVIFAILACVGLVTVITKSISLFSSYSSGETRKEGFEKVLYPAVIMDIESFNSPSELPSEQILTAAIWSMIMADGITEQYELTFDVVTIPATDVESYAVKLFGDNLPELTHTTVGPAEARFYYNEETKSYNVPVAPVTYTYTPEIKKATKNGSDYIVEVNYIDELPAWLPKTSSKSVQFTISQNNGEYQIKSMKILATNTNAV